MVEDNSFLRQMVAKNDNLNGEIKEINSQLVRANEFNENASLGLDLIYNFFNENRNAFNRPVDRSVNTGAYSHMDDFFSRNGYLPVKVINPCCKEGGGGAIPPPPKRPPPRNGAQEAPQTVPVPKTVPMPNPIMPPVMPPITSPGDAPIRLPQFEPAPNVSPAPGQLPAPAAPDAPISIPQPPAPDLLPEPAVPMAPFGDPMGTGVEGMQIDPYAPMDENTDWVTRMISEHPVASMALVPLAGLLAAIGLPELSLGLGAAGILAPATAGAGEMPPVKTNPTQSPVSDFTPISYTDTNSTIEIQLNADEISFVSDHIKFVQHQSSMGRGSSSSGYTNASYGRSDVLDRADNNARNPLSSGMTEITTASGIKTSVASEYAANFQGFINELEASGYKINSLGGYANRTTAAGGHSWHSDGMAIDINPSQNPHTFPGSNNYGQTDLPANVGEMAARYGIGWGGNWRSSKDTMHFSMGRNEGGDTSVDAGKSLNEMSKSTFMNSKVPTPDVKPSAPIPQQNINYNRDSSPQILPNNSNPLPPMTTFEHNLFSRNPMFSA